MIIRADYFNKKRIDYFIRIRFFRIHFSWSSQSLSFNKNKNLKKTKSADIESVFSLKLIQVLFF